MTDSDPERDDSYEDKQIQQRAAEQKLHINQSTGSMELITTNTNTTAGKTYTIQDDCGVTEDTNNIPNTTSNCCCCTYSKGIFCWNILLVLFNILTSGRWHMQ